MYFRQNFRQKKILSPFQKKTLAETVHYIPKGLRKGNPFHGPFAQLSCRSIEKSIIIKHIQLHLKLQCGLK